MKTESKTRSAQGSTLALIVAITVGIVVALIFFFMNFGRLLGGWGQQKTAIEAAALAAATDVSRIVIETNTCGYVSTSDSAPVGSSTAANDGYYLPVHSINTLIGMARLDLIIADQINDPTMEALAYQDTLNIVNDALPSLQLSIMDAILPNPQSGPYTDINGNLINTYQDALSVFQSNRMNMTGSAQMVPNSFQLSIGYLNKPTPTNIPIPQPQSYDGLTTNQYTTGQVNNINVPVYLSYTDMPYNGNNVSADYMLAGIGNNVSLGDVRNFQAIPNTTTFPAAVTKVPQFTPQMVAMTIGAQAQIQDINSQDTTTTAVQQASCAQPGNSLDPRPAPGSLVFSFPDGQVQEVSTVNSLFTLGGNFDIANTAAILTPSIGDYPGPPGATSNNMRMVSTLPNGNSVWPLTSPSIPATTIPPTVWQVVHLGIYDWIRSGGVTVPIDQTMTFITSPKTTLLLNPGQKDWAMYPDGSGTKYDITKSAQPPGPQIPDGYFYAFKWVNQNPTSSLSLSIQQKAVTNYTTADVSGQMVKPMPYSVMSNGQLYAEQFSAITNSAVGIATWKNLSILQIGGMDFGGTFNPGDNTLHQASGGLATNSITALNVWDVTVRSQICYPGPSNDNQPAAGVFDHAGQPLPNPNVTVKPDSLEPDKDIKVALNGKRGSAESSDGGAGGQGAGLFGFGFHSLWHWGSFGFTSGTGGWPQNHATSNNPAGLISSEGMGVFPILGPENDFNVGSKTTLPTPYPVQYPNYWTYAEPYVSPYPGGPQRPVYWVNGNAVEIRFRRQCYAVGQVTAGTSTATTTTYTGTGQNAQDTGYFAEEEDNYP